MIIWGRKRVRSPLGFAADYCPICGGAQQFAITRVGSARHLYFITVDEGELVGYTRTCTTCSIELDAEPSHYARLAPVPMALNALRQATHPNFDAVYQAQLEQDAALRFGLKSLTPQERVALITRPFMLLANRVSARVARSSFDWGGAFIKGEVLPILVRALQRLRPTAQELDLVLQQLRQRRELIGTKVPRDALLAALAAAPMAGLPGPAAAGGTTASFHYKALSSLHQRRAGGLLRGLGYLLGAAVAVGALAGLGSASSGNNPAEAAALWIGLAALAFGLVMSGRAVTAGKAWGRQAGMLAAVPLVLTFPVGTVAGLYLLWCLALRWPTPMTAGAADDSLPSPAPVQGDVGAAAAPRAAAFSRRHSTGAGSSSVCRSGSVVRRISLSTDVA